MSEIANESTLRITFLRRGVELTRLARLGSDADASKYAETWRPSVGEIVELPEWQARSLVQNGAADFVEEEG